jgi:hypothetical protein
MDKTPPVLLLIFNRPDLTEQVIDRIRQVEPSELFIAADGPRERFPEDDELCEEAREVATQIDWDCEMHTLFRSANLGLKEAVSSAITWFFEHVEAGIILEDDCVPHHSFFPYCARLLERYQRDTRVSMISGQNPLGTWKENESSYHFSNFGGIWGWATWKDMWNMYEIDEEFRQLDCIWQVLESALGNNIQVVLRSRGVKRALSGELESWDYQWFYARLLNHTLAVAPSRNLVTNIGFGESATHTTQANDRRQKSSSINFPLISPKVVFPDKVYDREWFLRVRNLHSRSIKNAIKRKKIEAEYYLHKMCRG